MDYFMKRDNFIFRTAKAAFRVFRIFMTFPSKEKDSREQISILVGANSVFARTKLGVCPE